jgi:hypothetical protein
MRLEPRRTASLKTAGLVGLVTAAVLLAGCKPAGPAAPPPAAPITGLEVNITGVERDAGACNLSGIVINHTDNHLAAFSIEQNSIITDLTANARMSSPVVILTRPVQLNQQCAAIAQAFEHAAQPPFVSQCQMDSTSEGQCQRLVQFTYNADLSSVQKADAEAQADYDQQQKDNADKEAHAADLPQATAQLNALLAGISNYAKPREAEENAQNLDYDPNASNLNRTQVADSGNTDNLNCAPMQTSDGVQIPVAKHYIAQFGAFYKYATDHDRALLIQLNNRYFTDQDVDMNCGPPHP